MQSHVEKLQRILRKYRRAKQSASTAVDESQPQPVSY